MIEVTARELYDKLILAWILTWTWVINLSLLNVTVKIKEKSALWDLIEEWLWEWMKANNIYFWRKHNSQEFPDFLLKRESNEEWLLEIKTFDATKAPNFDVANFQAYVRSVKTNSYRLNADYLIFGYILNDQWELSIDSLSLKKVWEMTCPSERFPIKTQVKQDIIYNIRPANWFSNRTSFPIFDSKIDFINAIQWTLDIYDQTSETHREWKNWII